MSYIAVLCLNRHHTYSRTRTPITAHKFCNHFLPFDKFGRMRVYWIPIIFTIIPSIQFCFIEICMRRPKLDSKVRMHTDERDSEAGLALHAIGKGKEIKSKTAVVPVIKITMPTNLTTIKYVIHTKCTWSVRRHTRRHLHWFQAHTHGYTKQYTYKSISTDKQQKERTTHLSPSTYLRAVRWNWLYSMSRNAFCASYKFMATIHSIAGTLLFVVLSSIQNYVFLNSPKYN